MVFYLAVGLHRGKSEGRWASKWKVGRVFEELRL